jgi:hypothetical protein
LTTTEAEAAAKPSPVASQRSTSAKADEEDEELQRRQHALHDRPRGGVAPPALFLRCTAAAQRVRPHVLAGPGRVDSCGQPRWTTPKCQFGMDINIS